MANYVKGISYCAVPHCPSGPKVPGHRFPKKPAQSECWRKAIGCTNLASKTSEQLRSYRVCHEHFTDNDYIFSLHRRILKHDVVPSQNIGQQNQNVLNVSVPASNTDEHNSQFVNTLPQTEAVSNPYNNDTDSIAIIEKENVCDVQSEDLNTVNETLTKTAEEAEEEVCRLCAKKSRNHVLMFGDNNLFIPEKISRCLPIVVLSNDELPSYICKRCLHYLNISYKLSITTAKVDAFLRKQLEIKKAQENLHMQNMLNDPSGKTNIRNPSLTQLIKTAIAGPAECEFCDIIFEDIDAFDKHIETTHMLQWRCNLCEDSFESSSELVLHKTKHHNGSYVICKSCVASKEGDNEQNTTAKTKENKSLAKESSISDTNKDIKSKHTNVITQEATVVENNQPCSSAISNSLISIETNKKLQQSNIICKKKQELSCEVCKICFDDERYFSAHKTIHDLKHIACSICLTVCSSIYNLCLHKRQAHNRYKNAQLKYVCGTCCEVFNSSWQWEAHRSVCRRRGFKFSCKYCESVFTTNFQLLRHFRKHKAEMLKDPTVTIYKCVSCPKVFVDKEFYQKHRNVHDPECWDKFRCKVCNKPFRDNRRLREHQLSEHQPAKLHKCDLCGKSFHRLHSMTQHRSKHVTRNCSHCDKVYLKMRDLKKHMREEHNIQPAKKTLRSKRIYISRPHICRYCGQKLASYQTLINHEHIHTGEKPYSCKICQKTFRSNTSRWAHTQRHDKRKFVCEYCGKCFSYRRNFRMHVLTHLPVEDRKHQCETCGKRFLRKCHLKIHTRIHDGVRPYTCDICLFSFRQKGDMIRHRRRHSKGDIRKRASKYKSIIVTLENSNKNN